MPRHNYDDEDFLELFDCFIFTESKGLGARGSKWEAWQEWKRLKKSGELPPLDEIKKVLRAQVESFIIRQKQGDKTAKFKHVCRWLKNRCYEDLPVTQSSDLETVKNNKFASLADRSWAD